MVQFGEQEKLFAKIFKQIRRIFVFVNSWQNSKKALESVCVTDIVEETGSQSNLGRRKNQFCTVRPIDKSISRQELNDGWAL